MLDASLAPPAHHTNECFLAFAFPDGSTESFQDIDVTMFAWMPDHGHGSAAPVTIEAGVAHGDYTLSGLDLHMTGDFEFSST